MGVQGSWAVVKRADLTTALSGLGLTPTGEIDFFGESEIICARWPGWVFLAGDFNFITPEWLSLLSAQSEAVGCRAHETVMESAVFGFRGGQLAWAVSHKPDTAPDNLELIGTPPAQLAGIRADAERRIAADHRDWVDYAFDVPLELMKTVCGFRLDRGEPMPPEAVFYVIEPLQTGAKGIRQARMRTRHEALTSAIEGDLYAAAEEIGFERLTHHPRFLKFHPFGATNVFVRLRQGVSEMIIFKWGFDRGAPYIRVEFFVLKDAEPREGTPGWMAIHGPKPKFWEPFLGRECDPDEVSKTMVEARHALAELDRHLRTGEAGRRITPASYADRVLE